MGNLSENNELTALKSSGLSLPRILRPLTFIILIIAITTFYFANYVIPVANLKWHSLIFDIQNTKISTILTPGVYSMELDGYAIKVDEELDENRFKGILIHDHTFPDEIKSIRAEEGKIYKSDNGKYLYFEMKNGVIFEEMSPQTPRFTPNGQELSQNSHPARRSSFDQATYKIDLSGFSLHRSDEELITNRHEMVNVFQIDYVIDSIKRKGMKLQNNFISNALTSMSYINALQLTDSLFKKSDSLQSEQKLVSFNKLTKEEKKRAIILAQSELRAKKQNVTGQISYMNAFYEETDRYLIEYHRKFALTVAIVILFFIGAPLGAIVKRGGFGAPVVIAALLFMVYFVLMSLGEGLAESGTLTPVVGMWFPSFVLTPIAILLMRAASNDIPLSSRALWFGYKKKKR